MLNYKKILCAAIILFVLVALCPGRDCFALISEENDSLYFQMGLDTIFVNHSTDYGDTIATLPFEMKFDSLPAANVKKITFKVKFDPPLEFLDGYKDSTNWSGDITIITTDSTVAVTLSKDTVLAPTSYTPYAYLRFTLKCQAELTANPVEFVGEYPNCIVELENEDEAYPPDDDAHLVSGSVTGADYDATFTIYNDSLEGAIGEEITVPVYAQTNFRIWSIIHYIVYDSKALTLVGYTPTTEYALKDTVDVRGDTLIITRLNAFIAYEDEYATEDILYELKFEAIYDTAWDGYSTDLKFIDDSCHAGVFDSIMSCNQLNDPYDLIDGSLYLDRYEAKFTMDYNCPGCDSVVSRSDDEARVAINLENNFRAGDTALPDESIIINFDYNPYFGFGGFDDNTSDEVKLVYYAHSDSVSVRQAYDAGLDNYYDKHHDATIFWLDLDFDTSSYTPDYSSRYVDIKYIICYMPDFKFAHVYDITGEVFIHYWNEKMVPVKDSVEVLVGEFSTAQVAGDTCTTTQPLRVRSTFDLDHFSVTVSCLGSGVYMDGIDTGFVSGVTYQRIDAFSYRVYTSGDFEGIEAGGEDYTKVADIKYKTPSACWPAEWIEFAPAFSNDTMKNTSSQNQYVALAPDSVSVYCWFCPVNPPPKGSQSDETALLPTEFKLHPCHPNPFNAETIIDFDLPKNGRVRIEVLNILGRKVATLIDDELEAGYHSVSWNGANRNGFPVSSGVYLCIMHACDYRHTEKMTLLK
ncbi:MAG: hypothetical protein JSU69_05475 [Candidatus Zixiibacteriota bacterium]|nr:MAG: hypothetical protein JSU69_05475 [candidate division Zixibacteria bacterium]